MEKEKPSPHHFRSSDPRKSPEFEFWNPGHHPHPSPPTLHSADEIFSRGFLLPLNPLSHHHHHPDPDPDPDPDPGPEPNPEPDPEPSSASILSSSGNSILTASKRWKEIFKRSEKKSSEKKEKKITNNSHNNNITGCSSSSAELNINIWPFSRSRSAGNNASRSRPAGLANRKVSSAPCSRSNSSGESKSRRSWPSSPGRTGVYLGRSSPVWQMRRNRAGSEENRRVKVYGIGGGGAGKGRVLNLNVPMCMGYRQGLSCRSEESGGGDGGDGGGSGGGRVRSGGGGSGGGNGNLFSLRGLFSKKGVVTV